MIQGKEFVTSSLCESGCCVAINQNRDLFYMGDSKNQEQPPLYLPLNIAECFKEAIRNGEFDLEIIKRYGHNSQYGFAVILKEQSIIVSLNIVSHLSLKPLEFTLKEWNAFINGFKQGKFDYLEMVA